MLAARSFPSVLRVHASLSYLDFFRLGPSTRGCIPNPPVGTQSDVAICYKKTPKSQNPCFYFFGTKKGHFTGNASFFRLGTSASAEVLLLLLISPPPSHSFKM